MAIKANSRIDQFIGIRFYEQDVLFDDYIYNDTVSMDLTIDYLSPGFGVILFNSASTVLNSESEFYLFRIGHREFSVIYKNGNTQKTLARHASLIEYPTENLNIKFIKNGKNVSVILNNDIYNSFSYKLPRLIIKYNLGLYSNAGNIVKHISTDSKIPNYWNINMLNTKGGRIYFTDNSINLSDCREVAEIEQSDIFLPAGTYYLLYDLSANSDIQCYAFYSNDPRLIDTEKNILYENQIVLEADGYINIKFVGKTGTVSNVMLSEFPSALYVATMDQDSVVPSSFIKIHTVGVDYIEFTAKIINIYDLDDSAYIFKTDIDTITLDMVAGINLDSVYKYKIDITNTTLYVMEDTTVIYQCNFTLSDYVYLFYNTDAIIDMFTVYKTNNTYIDYITDNIKTLYVSFSRNSPIVICNTNNEPLDISSSYRIIPKLNANGEIMSQYNKFVFTNIEREIFEPSVSLYLTNNISDKINAVKVYGIFQNAETNVDLLNYINNGIMHDISLCCNNYYEVIDSEYYTYSVISNEIYLNIADLDKYEYIVVDYLKEDSYAINADYERQSYSIEISSQYNDLYYYFNDNDLNTLSTYKIESIQNLNIDASSYLCLRAE